MSDTSNVDTETVEIVPSTPVAPPPGGEQPGSTPAPGDTPAAEPEEPKTEEVEKQSRREARAFATLRRENRELYRRLGGLEAMLQQQQPQPQAGDASPPQRQSPAPDPAQDELNRSILDKIEDAGEEYEAVVEKISAPNFPISVAMRDYLATSDKPAQVAKLLADDPKEARRISLLGDRAADRAMEQLETRMNGSKAAPRVTKALPPVRTVGGSSTARQDPAKMSMEEYAEWRLKRS